jgi:cystathionine beta-lyase family protein involved in aluminum resistance
VEHFEGVGKIENSLCSIDGKKYLFGNIVRVSKLPKGKGNNKVMAYDMQWEDLVLGETKIDLQVIMPAIEFSTKMMRRQKLSGFKGWSFAEKIQSGKAF